MEYLLVLIAAPIAVWLLDRVFFRGEFTEAVWEAIGSRKAAAKTPAKKPVKVRIN